MAIPTLPTIPTLRVLSPLKVSPLAQPFSEPRLDLLSLVFGMTQGDQVVGVPDQDRGVQHRLTGMSAGLLVADPSGLLHPVQRHVE